MTTRVLIANLGTDRHIEVSVGEPGQPAVHVPMLRLPPGGFGDTYVHQHQDISIKEVPPPKEVKL